MARKKLSEMSYMERLDKMLKGASWEDAEQVGIEILARCMSIHILVREEGSDYIEKVYKRIGERCQEWANEHSYEIAAARIALKREKELC